MFIYIIKSNFIWFSVSFIFFFFILVSARSILLPSRESTIKTAELYVLAVAQLLHSVCFVRNSWDFLDIGIFRLGCSSSKMSLCLQPSHYVKSIEQLDTSSWSNGMWKFGFPNSSDHFFTPYFTDLTRLNVIIKLTVKNKKGWKWRNQLFIFNPSYILM